MISARSNHLNRKKRPEHDLTACGRMDHTNGHAFPQDFDSACADFGGCSYLDLCTSEHPEDWYGEYIERRWNPLTRQEA